MCLPGTPSLGVRPALARPPRPASGRPAGSCAPLPFFSSTSLLAFLCSCRLSLQGRGLIGLPVGCGAGPGRPLCLGQFAFTGCLAATPSCSSTAFSSLPRLLLEGACALVVCRSGSSLQLSHGRLPLPGCTHQGLVLRGPAPP